MKKEQIKKELIRQIEETRKLYPKVKMFIPEIYNNLLDNTNILIKVLNFLQPLEQEQEPEELVKKSGKCKNCIYIETSICDFPCFRCNDYAKYTLK